MIYNAISDLLLTAPTIWEHENDREGDLNKREDVPVRITIGLFVAAVGIFFDRNIIFGFNLSMAIHFMFFDYWIAYTLLKNKIIEPKRGEKLHWFTYTAKDGFVDNISWWKKMHPVLKLMIRIFYFVGSILIYYNVWK